ncbi:MAG: serine hydrolase domain-containing protein [Cyclobacteriaceae bacterium]
MNQIRLFVWIVCLFGPGGLLAQKVDTQLSVAREMAQTFVKAQQIPGFCISVYQDGRMVWSEGLGYADLELEVPTDAAKTRFRIGSVSKSFTSVALAQLYEAGKLDLDVPIQTYVPSFPKKKYDITLRQLGGHLAGIRHYQGEEFLSTRRYATVEEGLAIFAEDTLLFKPGTNYAYSSYGWNLISAAIEQAAEEDFLSYMENKVFKAMHMDNTVSDYPEKIIAHRTSFYVLVNDTIYNAPYVDNSYKWAGGGFLSTTEDLITFGKTMMQPGFLKEETLSTLFDTQKISDGNPTDYGIGWFDRKDESGRRWTGHSGGSVGGTTMFMFNREANIIVAMAANRSDVEYDDFHFKIAAHFIDDALTRENE